MVGRETVGGRAPDGARLVVLRRGVGASCDPRTGLDEGRRAQEANDDDREEEEIVHVYPYSAAPGRTRVS